MQHGQPPQPAGLPSLGLRSSSASFVAAGTGCYGARRWNDAFRPNGGALAPAAAMPQETDAMTKLDAADRKRLDDDDFAFPEQRKEPLKDAAHVRDAIARFDQVEGVSDADRDAAWKRILAAAKKHGVEVGEKSWRELGKPKHK